MNALHHATWAMLVLTLFALAPTQASASKAAKARGHSFTYHDRTPRVHDETPKQHSARHKS